jgi:arginyl-tRNA synthetase
MLITLLDESRASGVSPVTQLKDLESFYIQAKKRFDADPSFQAKARENVVKLQSGDPATLNAWRTLVSTTRDHYQPIYQRLGVLLTESDERGESTYNPLLPSVVADLKTLGLAVESEGATVVPVEGFEAPLIVEKTGGGFLYGTTDLAAVRYRVSQLHADRIIYLVDSRQSQHFAQVFAVAKKASWTGSASLEHAAFGTMLGEDGKPFKTRTGGVVKLTDLLDEAVQRALKLVAEKRPDLPESHRAEIARAVGISAVKYADLSKDRVSDSLFSFDKMLALEGNTAPYLQYMYARIRSIFRKAGEVPLLATTIKLESPHELSLAKHFLRLGDVIDAVGRELKPHHLTNYLYDLASRFSGFFENCPVLQSEEPTRSSRLALIDLAARTMARGLDLLGIEHPEQM